MARRSDNRWRLREATASCHARLDRGMARLDLARPEDYLRFLDIMYAAVAPLERRLEEAGIAELLPDWPDRRRAASLKADLAGLGRDVPPAPVVAPDLRNPAETMGAAYVLEGSRLGAKVLLRQARAGGTPIVLGNTRFLSQGDAATLWPDFLTALDLVLTGEDDRKRAVHGAYQAFAVCQASLDREMAAPQGGTR